MLEGTERRDGISARRTAAPKMISALSTTRAGSAEIDAVRRIAGEPPVRATRAAMLQFTWRTPCAPEPDQSAQDNP